MQNIIVNALVSRVSHVQTFQQIHCDSTHKATRGVHIRWGTANQGVGMHFRQFIRLHSVQQTGTPWPTMPTRFVHHQASKKEDTGLFGQCLVCWVMVLMSSSGSVSISWATHTIHQHSSGGSIWQLNQYNRGRFVCRIICVCACVCMSEWYPTNAEVNAERPSQVVPEARWFQVKVPRSFFSGQLLMVRH